MNLREGAIVLSQKCRVQSAGYHRTSHRQLAFLLKYTVYTRSKVPVAPLLHAKSQAARPDMPLRHGQQTKKAGTPHPAKTSNCPFFYIYASPQF